VIVEGEHEIGAKFSQLPFDHLIFTGSTTIGSHVAKAAAENLTPLTLELGGKSPVIFADDANFETAIDSVILGKTFNSGQVCVAPDYIFVPRKKQKHFITLFKTRYRDYFLNTKVSYPTTHIINKKQYDRLQAMLKDAENKGAEIHTIEEGNPESEVNVLNMHLVTNTTDNMILMKEEIFGPILPIILYDSLDECIDYINARNRPLGLYIMSSNKETITKVLTNTHSGGACVNDTSLQAIAEDAPFGGVGKSGVGHYHGKEGFLQLSKAKTVILSKAWLPKNKIFLKQKSLIFKLLRMLLMK